MVSLPRRRDSAQKGFTLIELLIVVTIVGLLAGLAVVNVRHAQRKAAENVLRGSLANMRKAIDDFYADKQRFPSTLEELVPGYLRKIPADPITKSADTWIEVQAEPDLDSGSSWDSGTTWDDPMAGQGVIDVRSGAEGETMDDPPVPYGEL